MSKRVSISNRSQAQTTARELSRDDREPPRNGRRPSSNESSAQRPIQIIDNPIYEDPDDFETDLPLARTQDQRGVTATRSQLVDVPGVSPEIRAILQGLQQQNEHLRQQNEALRMHLQSLAPGPASLQSSRPAPQRAGHLYRRTTVQGGASVRQGNEIHGYVDPSLPVDHTYEDTLVAPSANVDQGDKFVQYPNETRSRGSRHSSESQPDRPLQGDRYKRR